MKPGLPWVVAAALAFVTSGAGAQTAGRTPMPDQSPTALTIDQAVALAKQNNPDFQSTRNNARNAALELRTAYGALLPQLSANLTGQYQQGGQQFFNGVSLSANSDVMQSQYNLGLNYSINAGTFIAPKVQRANSAAVNADIAGASEALAATVKQDYLTALQSLALAQLNDSLVANAQVQLELARAKAQVGTGTLLDVQRAEVALGQQQVALLQARNQNEIDKLRLFQQMGVAQPPNVELVTTFGVRDSLPTLDALLDMARAQNPGIVALRSRETVAEVNRRLVEGGISVYGLQEVHATLEDWFLSVTSRLGEQS